MRRDDGSHPLLHRRYAAPSDLHPASQVPPLPPPPPPLPVIFFSFFDWDPSGLFAARTVSRGRVQCAGRASDVAGEDGGARHRRMGGVEVRRTVPPPLGMERGPAGVRRQRRGPGGSRGRQGQRAIHEICRRRPCSLSQVVWGRPSLRRPLRGALPLPRPRRRLNQTLDFFEAYIYPSRHRCSLLQVQAGQNPNRKHSDCSRGEEEEAMDFHSMPRRQLQALCKQNRVPANITNVAMAEALQALHSAGLLENAQEALQDLTPRVSSSCKAASRRRPHAESMNLDSLEPWEQPASPLPRARRVTVKASEIWRLGVEGDEDEIEEEKKETLSEATPLTVTKCSSMKPPTRRLKKDLEAKEGEPADAMKTPAALTRRQTVTRKVTITPVVVEQEDGDTVFSARVTACRNKITRQSTRAATEDGAASTVRRSARIRAKTEESAVKIGSSFLEVEPEQGGEDETTLGNAPVEEINNGEKDRDLVAVDTVVQHRSLEEAAISPEVKEFAAVSGVLKQLDKEEVDNHCEKDCNLVAIGANILINNLEENGKTPDAEQSAIIEKEVMDVATKEVDEVAEMAPKAEEFDDAELGSVAQHHEEEVDEDDEITPEAEEFADEELGSVVQRHEGVKIKGNFDGNEDEVCIDGDRIVESGANDANEDEVIQETEVSIGEFAPETDCEFKASPVQGIITSLENLVITKDDVTEHTKEEEEDEIKRATDEKGGSEEIDHDDEIPGVAVNSIIQNQVPSIPDCDDGVKIIAANLQDEVFVIHVVNAGCDDEMLEEVKESYEILAKVAGSPAKSTSEAIEAIEHSFVKKFQFSGADEENGIYSDELNTQVVNDNQEQNVLENLSIRKLKKMYKEKIISNVSQVETKRQALNDVNYNIV